MPVPMRCRRASSGMIVSKGVENEPCVPAARLTASFRRPSATVVGIDAEQDVSGLPFAPPIVGGGLGYARENVLFLARCFRGRNRLFGPKSQRRQLGP